MDPLPLAALMAVAPLVTPVQAVHLTDWWSLRLRRLQRRLPLEEAR